MGQQKDNKPYTIYYTSQNLDEAQVNYATMEKEFLVVVFTLEKFRSYLVNSKGIIFTNNAAFKYLLKQYNFKPRLV